MFDATDLIKRVTLLRSLKEPVECIIVSETEYHELKLLYSQKHIGPGGFPYQILYDEELKVLGVPVRKEEDYVRHSHLCTEFVVKVPKYAKNIEHVQKAAQILVGTSAYITIGMNHYQSALIVRLQFEVPVTMPHVHATKITVLDYFKYLEEYEPPPV